MPVDAVTASQENRESCVNHERYRHCKRGGSAKGESRSLEKSEKAVQNCWSASQETCLDISLLPSCELWLRRYLCCVKTAATSLLWCCGFCFYGIKSHGRFKRRFGFKKVKPSRKTVIWGILRKRPQKWKGCFDVQKKEIWSAWIFVSSNTDYVFACCYRFFNGKRGLYQC